MSLYTLDLTLRLNQILIVMLFLLSGFMFSIGKYSWSSLILVLTSILLILNGVNLVICLILMGLGVFIAFQEGG